MACIKGSYTIEDRCLQDNFGLVLKMPWEPNLTLVQFITLRDRADRKNEPNSGRYVAYVRDGPIEELGRIVATNRVPIQQLSKSH
jgi:hypothetical protein